ncbi:MAG: putative Ig domain-containing protein [Proteobacteria bacterium]|nr:putative Ig domain-containing protein [Pseudomonadota bacterium]
MLTAIARLARHRAVAARWLFLGMILGLPACGGGGGGGSDPPPPPPPVLAVATEALPDAQVGTAYSSTLTATGGTLPYSWSISSGALPPGLSLDGSTGAISGTPTTAITAAPLTVTVHDAGNPAQSSSGNLTLNVIPSGILVLTNYLPDGQVGTSYSAALSAKGGVTPYTWQLTSGTLPAGLQLDGAAGMITGTPTSNVKATPLAFKVTDSSSPTGSAMTAGLALTISAPPLLISTTLLPDGQTGTPYNTTLAATGGTGAVSWAVTTGTLPAGLHLNAATGLISGTPTASGPAVPLTVTASDSGSPVQKVSAAYTLTVNPSGISVDVTPRRAALTVTQALTLSAVTNDPGGVTWSVSPAGGSFSPAASTNGANVTFTAPGSAGVYTVTATSVTDTTRSASIPVAVTDLAGVYTYHNDLARTGANTREFALTAASVNVSTFGKLFSCTVDGAIYAQPLWVANLTVNGSPHNVVFVATAHDSLYAFDADAASCNLLWAVSLIDAAHGGSGTETTVPAGPSGTGNLVGAGYGDISPEVGVIGTPVIDPATSTLYVISKSVSADQTVFYQRLHAIDLATGSEKSAGSPLTISATFSNNLGGTVSFSPRMQNQRAGLALSGGKIWAAWGAHEDVDPWFGWVMGFTYSNGNFAQVAVFNTAPNAGRAGIWMSGGAPSFDASGNLYVITGNGTAQTTSAPPFDYGDSFLQLNPASGNMNVNSYFTPANASTLATNDGDFGAGGAALLLNLAAGSPAHLAIGAGKDGALYVLNGDNLGGTGQPYQSITIGASNFSTGAFWNNTLYISPVNTPLLAYTFDPTAKLFSPTLAMQSDPNFKFGFPGATASISASSASTDGIVWAINSSAYCTAQSGACGPAQLFAFSAAALGTTLWNSTTIGSDAAGNAVKFTVPTVANGKVYVGTRGDNRGDPSGSTAKAGELDVYGLKPN